METRLHQDSRSKFRPAGQVHNIDSHPIDEEHGDYEPQEDGDDEGSTSQVVEAYIAEVNHVESNMSPSPWYTSTWTRERPTILQVTSPYFLRLLPVPAYR